MKLEYEKNRRTRAALTDGLRYVGAGLALIAPATAAGIFCGVDEAAGGSVDYVSHAPAAIYAGAGAVTGFVLGALIGGASDILFEVTAPYLWQGAEHYAHKSTVRSCALNGAVIGGLAGLVLGEVGSLAGRVIGLELGSDL